MKHVAGFALLLTLGLAFALPEVARGQTVTFPDPNLEAAVRAQLGKPVGNITTNDMLTLGELPAANRGISNLEGLEYALNLQHLDLTGNIVTDAGPLAGLTALQSLFLEGNHLTSGAPLAGLNNLTSLLVNGNSIHDTSWLTGLTKLQELGLMENPLGNGAALAGLTNLTDLYVNNTGISDLSWASGLHHLLRFGVGENGVTDASPLAGLTQLQFLGLGGSPLTTCAPLAALINLETLYLYGDSLTDVSCLAGLTKLTWLRLADNHLSDVSPLAGLTALQYLDLSGNPLASCTPLASLTHLAGLELGYDELTNLDFVQGMTVLTNLNAGNNQLTDINGLLGATHLRSVDLRNNPLDLSAGSQAAGVIQTLQGRGVTVQYTGQISGGGGGGGTYTPTNAAYNGLFYVADGVTASNSGSITLTTTSRGKYSGRLRMASGSYAFNGSLSTNGTATNVIKRGRLHSLVVDLVIPDTDDLTGTVTASQEDWTADIVGYRAIYDGRGRRAPQVGRYTMALAGGDSADLPAGNGYGTLMVNPAGKVNFAGSLADGTRVSQAGTISGAGQLPVFIPLYAGKGSVLSWIVFTNAQTLGGDLAWTKPVSPGKPYPAGFSWLTEATGALYTPPGRGLNVFGGTSNSLTLTLTGGSLKQDLATQFTLNSKNQLKSLSNTNRVSLSFTPSSGLFRGSAVDPDSKKRVSFSGVVLQNQPAGYGYFLGATNSGQVLLSP